MALILKVVLALVVTPMLVALPHHWTEETQSRPVQRVRLTLLPMRFHDLLDERSRRFCCPPQDSPNSKGCGGGSASEADLVIWSQPLAD